MNEGSPPSPEPGALADQVHVWWAPAPALVEPATRALFEGWLSGEEQARYQRYLREEHRSLYLVAHALLRHTLSRYADVAPEAWRFSRGEHGRPEPSAQDHGNLGLRFNLSHTPGLVACVVSDGTDAGIDVERTDRTPDPLRLAARVYSGRECRALEALEPAALNARFYELWTLREAYCKARGRGLALPMDGVSFAVEGERVRLEPCGPHDGDPRHWQFVLWRPTAEHQGALAIRRGDAPDRRVVFRRGLQLGQSAPPPGSRSLRTRS